MSYNTVENARSRFPRGLRQPDKGYRFSMDPLVLSCFADSAEGVGLDLGTGCGVPALALLLRSENCSMIGLDSDPDMVGHAVHNAGMLGFSSRFRVMHADVAEIRSLVEPESCDFVVSNPPYREPFRGRVNPDRSRASARFEAQGGLEVFVRAGAYAVKNKGLMFMVFPAERLSELLVELTGAKMEPKRLCVVHPREGEPANLVMVESRKNGGRGIMVDPPLIMYEGRGQDARLTDQALDFCPFIRCNP